MDGDSRQDRRGFLVVAAVLAGLALWAGWLAYSTFFPPRTPYRKNVEAIAELIGGRHADAISEARKILRQVDELVREPKSRQYEYALITNWLQSMHDGRPTESQKNEILAYHRGTAQGKTITWELIENDFLERAHIIIGSPLGRRFTSLKNAGDALKKRKTEIEKINKSEFNERLDDLIKKAEDAGDDKDLLFEINTFLAEEVPRRAMTSTLFKETIVVPYLVEMLDDEKAAKRARLYEVIVRIVALGHSEEITTKTPSEQAVGEVKAMFGYDPNARCEERRAAMEKIREWLNTPVNKKIYNPK